MFGDGGGGGGLQANKNRMGVGVLRLLDSGVDVLRHLPECVQLVVVIDDWTIFSYYILNY